VDQTDLVGEHLRRRQGQSDVVGDHLKSKSQSDLVGEHLRTKSQRSGASSQPSGYAGSLGERIQEGVDAGKGALVHAMRAAVDFADKAPSRLGEASLARQRAMSTAEQAALSPKRVGNELFGQMGQAALHPESQGEIDTGWQNAVQDLIERIPGVKTLLQNAEMLANRNVGMQSGGAPTFSLRPSAGHSLGNNVANAIREGIAQFGSDFPDASIGAALKAGERHVPGYATLGQTQARAVGSKLAGGPLKAPPGPAVPIKHPPFHTDPLYGAAQLTNALLQTKGAQKARNVIRDVVARFPAGLNPIVRKEYADVATPQTEARMRGALSANSIAESKRMQRQYETIREHADHMNAAGHSIDEVRLLGQEEAWINGTADVRKDVLADPITDRYGRRLLGIYPDLYDLPLLNIQTKYRRDYDPYTSIREDLDDFSDETKTRVLNSDWGFNLPQKGEAPNTPLSERWLKRLELGRVARADIAPIAAVFKELGLDRSGASDILEKHALRDLEAGPRIVPDAWRYQKSPGPEAEFPTGRGGTFFMGHPDSGYEHDFEDDSPLGGSHLIEAELYPKNPLHVEGGMSEVLNVLRPNKLGERLLEDKAFAAPPTEPGMPGRADIGNPPEPPNFDEVRGMLGNDPPAPVPKSSNIKKPPNWTDLGIGPPGLSAGLGSNVQKHVMEQHETNPAAANWVAKNIDWSKYKEALAIINAKGEQNARRFLRGAGLSPEQVEDAIAYGQNIQKDSAHYNEFGHNVKDRLAAELARKAGHDIIEKTSGERFVLDPSIIKPGVSKERIDRLKDAMASEAELTAADRKTQEKLWSERGRKVMANVFMPIGPSEADWAKIVHRRAGGFAYHKLTDQEKYEAIKAVHADMTRVTLPAAIASKMITPKAYEAGTNWLKKISDFGRKALFWIPFTHMKNISTLQYEGAGGGQTLARGAEIFLELSRNPKKHAKVTEYLEQIGSAPHFFEPPIEKIAATSPKAARLKNALHRGADAIYRWSNRQLWNWDLAQRIALHEHLLESGEIPLEDLQRTIPGNKWGRVIPPDRYLYFDDAGKFDQAGFDQDMKFYESEKAKDLLAKDRPARYADLSPFEQGAVINSVLFDYYHQSPMAEALRAAGAPFPHWTIGNLTLQGKQLLRDPRRMAALSRTQNVINANLFPSGTGYSLAANDPVSEASKTAGDLTTQFGRRTLVNKGGPLIGTLANLLEHQMDVQKVALPTELGDLAQGAVGGFLPGGTLGPQLLSALGARDVGEFLGADRYKSNAPEALRVLLSAFGASLPNDPSTWTERQRNLMDANWNLPPSWYARH
jgi:hypothetical protein